jgi:hypothetical protein
MRRFRPQFSLRALFVVTTICAVVLALMKCERETSHETPLRLL